MVVLTLLCVVHCLGDKTPKAASGTADDDGVNKNYNYKVSIPKEVVVIGAGIAGLAAARKLSSDRANFSVHVYEARRERFGGRIWTDKLTNMKAKGPDVDLGAVFLPGVGGKDDPLIELAEDFDLKTASLGELQLLIPWEKRVLGRDDLAPLLSETNKILELAVNESKASKTEMSVREAVDTVLKNKKLELSDSAYLIQACRSYVLEYSALYPQFFHLDFENNQVLLDGMGELTDRLLSGAIDEAPLHLTLNKAARQVKIDGERNKVVVRFTDGSQVVADAVVVAVPLSVIAAGSLHFEPFLPKAHYEAMKEMGFTSENRVIIQFEQVFWPQDVGTFVRAVRAEEEKGHLQLWFNIYQIVGVPALSGYLMGRPAEAFETLSDEEAEKAVLAVLLEMFGEALLNTGGKIVRLQRSAWVSDSWSKGAATYTRVGSSPKMWDNLSEPMCPGVYFAGEHTSFVGQGSVYGAYLSGLRAANQIMGDLCEQRRLEEEERERQRKEAEKTKEMNKGAKDNRSKHTELEDDSKDEL